MGRLRPVGSEKLEGSEKIKRIMEIARYNESIPQPVNETTTDNYNIQLADGNTYKISKEKNGYVIKKSINEGSEDYLEPMKNRKYYPSYSQALKRLNLIIKEVNSLVGNDDEISLFGEQKKYTLKTPKPAMDMAAPAPAPEPAPATDMGVPSEPAPAPADDMGGEEPMPDMGGEEMPADTGGDEPMPDMGGEMDGDEVTMKSIQKLTGKLGQKIRQFSQDQELSSNDAKYVINSILSAIDLTALEPEDKEEILSRLEGEEDFGDMGGEDMGGEDMGGEDMGGEDMGMPPASPEEMTEMDDPDSFKGGFGKLVGGAYSKNLKDKVSNFDGEMDESEYMEGLSKIMDSVFSESKVEKIISNYFKIDEKEKKLLESKNIKKNKVSNKKLESICETFKQETSSKKVVEKYPDAILLGKTNKKNLVFKINETQIKITPEGKIV